MKVKYGPRALKPTVDFLEMPTPMGESLCHLMRLDVKNLNLVTRRSYKKVEELNAMQSFLYDRLLSQLSITNIAPKMLFPPSMSVLFESEITCIVVVYRIL